MMAEKETEQEMNRKEFIKAMGAVAGTAALGNIGFAEEGAKKMNKGIVIYFSHTGENYSVGVIQGEEPLSREVHAVHRSRKEGNAGEGAPGVRRRGA